MSIRTMHKASMGFRGGVGHRIRSISAAYTLTVEDDHTLIVDTSGAAVTVTLPPAAEAYQDGVGLKYTIRCTSASNDITVDGDGAETINGAATLTISGATASQTLQSNGTAWFTV